MLSLPAKITGFSLLTAALVLGHPQPVGTQGSEVCAGLHQLLARDPLAYQAFWGWRVAELDGRELCSHESQRLFVPASNVKLFTAAAALLRLGQEYRFHTLVLAREQPGANGRVQGDLYLVGGGDPLWSERPVPYQPDSKPGDPLAPLRHIAQSLATSVRYVEGDVVADETRYVWEPYPPGWEVDDLQWHYAAPVSPLAPGESRFDIIVRPGKAHGLPAQLSDPVGFYEVENSVRTVRRSRTPIQVLWPLGNNRIRVYGEIDLDSGLRVLSLAIRDPAEFAAWGLRRELTRMGVVVAGRTRVERRWVGESSLGASCTGCIVLYDRPSPPLVEILKIMTKDSLNLAAELVLRELGHVQRRNGSRLDGLDAVRETLAQLGVPLDQVYLVDGSGLSRLSLASPYAISELLRRMYVSPAGPQWLELMAVAGRDGTLRDRLTEPPLVGRVRAKTGTLSHTVALSGYLLRRNLSPLVFSILVNHYAGDAAQARRLVDEFIRHLTTVFRNADGPQPMGVP